MATLVERTLHVGDNSNNEDDATSDGHHRSGAASPTSSSSSSGISGGNVGGMSEPRFFSDEALSVSDKKGHRKKEDVRQAVLNLLFAGQQALLLAVCQYSPSTDPSPLGMSLIVLLQQQGMAEAFLKRLFAIRLKHAAAVSENDVTNLIRDNSMLSTMLIAFAQIEGQEFMMSAMSSVVKSVLNDTEVMELNPEKAADKTVRERNLQRLEQYCHNIIAAVLASKHLIPPLFRRLCNYIKTNVDDAMKKMSKKKDAAATDASKSFPVSLKVLSSFIFLRYLLPALTSPEKFDLMESSRELTLTERQNFIMITKVLTNLANDVEMGQKEQHMLPVNAFLKYKRPSMLQFLNFIAEIPSEEDKSKPTKFSPEVIDAACTYMLTLVCGVLPKMERSLDNGTAEDELKKVKDKIAQLRQIVNKISNQNSRKFKFITINGMKSHWTLGRSGGQSSTTSMKKASSIGRITGKLKGRLAQQEGEDDDDDLDANDIPKKPPSGMKKSVSFGDITQINDIDMIMKNLPPVPTHSADAFDQNVGFRRRGSILPSESNLFKPSKQQKEILPFGGNFRAYLKKTSLTFDDFEIREDCIEILAPFLSYIWETLCRQIVATLAINLLGTDVIPVAKAGILEMESALNRVIPVTIAHFSLADRDKFPAYFNVTELQRDFSRLLNSDEYLRASVFGTPATQVVLDAAAAIRMVNVLDYIYYRTLRLTTDRLSSMARSFFRIEDIYTTIHTDPSLAHLTEMCTTSELRQPWLPPPLFDGDGAAMVQQAVVTTGVAPLNFDLSQYFNADSQKREEAGEGDATMVPPVSLAQPAPASAPSGPLVRPLMLLNQNPSPTRQQQQQMAPTSAALPNVPSFFIPPSSSFAAMPQQQQQQQRGHSMAANNDAYLLDVEQARRMQEMQQIHYKQQMHQRQQQIYQMRLRQEQLRQQQLQYVMSSISSNGQTPIATPMQLQQPLSPRGVAGASASHSADSAHGTAASSNKQTTPKAEDKQQQQPQQQQQQPQQQQQQQQGLLHRKDFRRLDASRRISHSWSAKAGDLIYDNPMLVKGRPMEPTGVDSIGARDGYEASGRPTTRNSGVFQYIY